MRLLKFLTGFVNELIEGMIERAFSEERVGKTFDEIAAPLRLDFQQSGMTNQEFDVLIEEAREEIWQEKQRERSLV